jgi:hypothetical protein
MTSEYAASTLGKSRMTRSFPLYRSELARRDIVNRTFLPDVLFKQRLRLATRSEARIDRGRQDLYSRWINVDPLEQAPSRVPRYRSNKSSRFHGSPMQH